MNTNHIMYRLFKSFEQNNIPYLHFKSNTNLSKSFSGEADFDVLVDKNYICKVEELILCHNGKRHNPSHIGCYPGVDNWLVFDEFSGIIHHLHLHYQLATGKPQVKDYILPWSNILFSTRIKDAEYGIYKTNPNVELVMLAYRMVLKSNLFDYLKKLFGFYRINKSMQAEWDDISKQVTIKELRHIVDLICPYHADEFVERVLHKELSPKDLVWLHKYVRHSMALHRRYSGYEAYIRSFVYRLLLLLRRKFLCKVNGWSITKKTSLQGGLIIAFIGVDGAGKSTISNEISSWIGKKIECKRYYMGTGDGQTTPFVSIMKLLRKKSKKNKIQNDNDAAFSYNNDSISPVVVSWYKTPLRYLKKMIMIEMIDSVQKNNYKKIKKMYQYKLNGGISVLDRWPQIEIACQNDGPKIIRYREMFGNNNYIRNKIEKEAQNLAIVREIKPDFIFRLNISLETCLKRKEENTNIPMFDKKIKELKQLEYQGANVIEIDAEQPYEEELLEIKRILWKSI